jgi:hypothetical protein
MQFKNWMFLGVAVSLLITGNGCITSESTHAQQLDPSVTKELATALDLLGMPISFSVNNGASFIDLLGSPDRNNPNISRTALFFGNSSGDFNSTGLGEIYTIAKEPLSQKKLSAGWPLAVKATVAKFPTAIIQISTAKKVSLEKIRDVLGKEDSVTQGTVDKSSTYDGFSWTSSQSSFSKTCPLTVIWFKYGWCEFAVSNDKIVALRSACEDFPR